MSDEDVRFPRQRPNGDRSLGELGRRLDDLKIRVDSHHSEGHVTRREFDSLVMTQRRLWWIIVGQLILMLGMAVTWLATTAADRLVPTAVRLATLIVGWRT